MKNIGKRYAYILRNQFLLYQSYTKYARNQIVIIAVITIIIAVIIIHNFSHLVDMHAIEQACKFVYKSYYTMTNKCCNH